MTISIIADDLTGASDSGVQLVNRGYASTVFLQHATAAADQEPIRSDHVFIYDTDTRHLSPEAAYAIVHQAAAALQETSSSALVFKKMDSTLRGNVAAELNAVYDALKPDFIVIAPAYPKAGRILRNGIMLVQGRQLHESGIAQNSKPSLPHSFVPEWLQRQTKQQVVHIPLSTLRSCSNSRELLNRYKRQGAAYLLFDAETENDLACIAAIAYDSSYRVVWAGSAGLAAYIGGESIGNSVRSPGSLPHTGNSSSRAAAAGRTIPEGPSLLVVGSIHRCTREQLELVLRRDDVSACCLSVERLIGDEPSRSLEVQRIFREAEQAFTQQQSCFVLYTSWEPDHTHPPRSPTTHEDALSRLIAHTLGTIGCQLTRRHHIRKWIATGGDTARQLCQQIGAVRFKLWEEISPGIPAGQLDDPNGILLITKAGGFGSPDALLHALRYWNKEVQP
ncbi:four-carbon acid sugar kinase family protein [Paenibacillus sp. J5C_2022]|uniref:four-carbon acid sugar kinase family protein n=1 Tax=Paenibacillus sp. J5C2022 TaxID=2977129 RepID=UPI0021CEB311|nr:four-carbon acid sugar kinase family protein [Paenibacillus sp. J5C2022]MCU6712907.1 four-carbon acid sugar kinase family protein [Paenibacillus sp. J5C2022]